MNFNKKREYYLKSDSDGELLVQSINSVIASRLVSNKDEIVVHIEGHKVPSALLNLAKVYDFITLEGIPVKESTPLPQKLSTENYKFENIEPANDEGYKVVISMTSWRGRLWRSAVPTLKSILAQEMTVPFKVVFVLSSDEIDPISIPDEIKEMEKLPNFELLWVKQDIRSHKKLMPVLMRYPNLPIIISDDDCIRNRDWAQALYDSYLKEPKMIHTWACGSLTKVENGTLEFDFNKPIDHPSILNRAANGNVGTLYPPHIFDGLKDFFNPTLYMKLSPTSDETWQWCFQALLGIKTKWIRKDSLEIRKLNRIKEVQDVALFKTNKDGYTKVYSTMLRMYPRLKEILTKALATEFKPLPKIVVKV